MSGWGMNDLEPQEKKNDTEKPVPEVQGFNLSQDYELLWKLICNGYRVPAWVKYTVKNLPDHVWYDIAEVAKHKRPDTVYTIGSRGIGHNSFCGYPGTDPKTLFMHDCKSCNLWYAIPNYKIPLL